MFKIRFSISMKYFFINFCWSVKWNFSTLLAFFILLPINRPHFHSWSGLRNRSPLQSYLRNYSYSPSCHINGPPQLTFEMHYLKIMCSYVCCNVWRNGKLRIACPKWIVEHLYSDSPLCRYQWGKEDGWVTLEGYPLVDKPETRSNIVLWVQERARFDPETH